jgi:hypothetical protein
MFVNRHSPCRVFVRGFDPVSFVRQPSWLDVGKELSYGVVVL